MATALQAPHDIEHLLTESDLARIVKRSVGSIRRDRLDGKGIPYRKLGKLVRYHPDDVRQYLESCRRTATHESKPAKRTARR